MARIKKQVLDLLMRCKTGMGIDNHCTCDEMASHLREEDASEQDSNNKKKDPASVKYSMECVPDLFESDHYITFIPQCKEAVSGFLTGAQITIYLLERFRVLKQAIGEKLPRLLSGARHIRPLCVYSQVQLLSGDSAELREQLKKPFPLLDWSPETWHTAAVSNLPILSLAADLFGVDTKGMEFNLVNRRNMIKGEYFVVALDMQQSCLSKALYGGTFNWLVDRILSCSSVYWISLYRSVQGQHFRTFCINFANEKLQQHYNRHTFKWEQDACLVSRADRLHKDRLEESNFPKATNQTLLQRLITNHTTKPKLSQSAFVVKHYAGSVSYEVAGFLEKNKDSLADDLDVDGPLTRGTRFSTTHSLRFITTGSVMPYSFCDNAFGRLALSELNVCGVIEPLQAVLIVVVNIVNYQDARAMKG
ncbi:class VII unconventional myosin [Planoprotostelium fungivorum]|uniref:Class VII unconventional myosin n=1 Tax=Planoprotostelium fungivorum TaxID=1890364 RepID=A0A2P6N6D1_9EUKA|nr:class VII unconventional myosin [Planoprotostelium fungivorum]